MSNHSKILVVDDSRFNRLLLKEILCNQYEVLEAENGREALDLLEQESGSIGVIILDLIMPLMDGFTFLDLKAQSKEWKDIPVLVSTSETSPNIEARCLELGALDFLYKPYRPDAIFLRIQNSMELWGQLQDEKKKVTDLLNLHMDSDVVTNLLSQDAPSMEIQSKEITVFYADICGFTSMSEQLPPEYLVSILNECLTLAGHCIKKHQGTLDKFIGDCAMAFWGAPNPCPDGAYLACRAALDIQKEVALLNETPPYRDHPIHFSIGIHKGNAVVGNVGMPEHMNYTVIGDTSNTASRLESIAGTDDIFISQSMIDALGNRVEAEYLGLHQLKGKTKGFPVYRLLRLKDLS